MNKLILTSFICLSLFFLSANYNRTLGQPIKMNTEWQHVLQGIENSDGVSRIIRAGKSGNIYIAGSFADTIDFDPGSGSALAMPRNFYRVGSFFATFSRDIFVAKYDKQGNFIWLKQFSSMYNQRRPYVWGAAALGMVLDSLENIYLSGCYEGDTLHFEPSQPGSTLNISGSDAFAAKLDSSGNPLWAKTLAYSYNADVDFNAKVAIAIDKQNDIYVTHGGKITKLSNTGTLIWNKEVGATASICNINSLVVDDQLNIYAAGNFRGTSDFDPGSGTTTLASVAQSSPTQDIFILKIGNTGNLYWAHRIGGNNNDIVQSIDIDQQGNCYVTGAIEGPVDMDPGAGSTILGHSSANNTSSFILKLSTNGIFQWANSIVSVSGNGYLSRNCGQQIVYKDNFIYATGSFKGIDVNFNPIDTQYVYSSGSFMSAYVLQMDTLGKIRWVYPIISSRRDIGYSIYIDEHDNIFSTGKTDEHSYYINKLTCRSFQTLSETRCDSFVLNGNTYKQSGLYIDTLVNANGCDSIVTLNLEINGNYLYLEDEGCDSFTLNGIVYKTSGEYEQTYPNVYGCDSTVKLSLTINTIVPTITNEGGTLKANTPDGSYQWIDCNTVSSSNVIEGATGREYVPEVSGRYAVIITLGSCKDTSECVTWQTSHTKDLENEPNQDINVFPNPAGNQITLISNSTFNSAFVRIIDIQGKILIKQENISTNQVSLDLSRLSNGLYFIEVIQDRKVSRIKIVKN